MSDSRGLAQQLVGMEAPAVELPFALEGSVSLATLARRRSLVVFLYPGVTRRAEGDDGGLDVDTARAWAWREHDPELGGLGCMVVGVSAQSPQAQARFAADELLGYMLLSDGELELARVLGLPTMSVAEGRVYEPLTLIVRGGRIARVFHPVAIDPAQEAASVTSWMRSQGFGGRNVSW